jgi:hypothetical protein
MKNVKSRCAGSGDNGSVVYLHYEGKYSKISVDLLHVLRNFPKTDENICRRSLLVTLFLWRSASACKMIYFRVSQMIRSRLT